MREVRPQRSDRYRRIYTVVQQIPSGRVATYGQIATIVGDCTARVVGYAMAATPDDLDLPWQRVINSRGEVSTRSGGSGAVRQRRLLEDEGVAFDAAGKVDFDRVGWEGPDWPFLEANGFHLAPPAGVPRPR